MSESGAAAEFKSATNMIRLYANWAEHPLGRDRTSTLERLSYRSTA
ncbi:hypothetical protein [Streptomyces carpinensis]|uniref:Uncharacterized protein n=1 Tax=Streptomyces carpinensis TaxID=66369 RepID=A0ABV1VWY6_9ACTN|nr:hypothetical protein [Streptomyces carpinensis]